MKKGMKERSFGDRVAAAAAQGCRKPVSAGNREPSGRDGSARARYAAQRIEGKPGSVDDSRLRPVQQASAGTPPAAGTFTAGNGQHGAMRGGGDASVRACWSASGSVPGSRTFAAHAQAGNLSRFNPTIGGQDEVDVELGSAVATRLAMDPGKGLLSGPSTLPERQESLGIALTAGRDPLTGKERLLTGGKEPRQEAETLDSAEQTADRGERPALDLPPGQGVTVQWRGRVQYRHSGRRKCNRTETGRARGFSEPGISGLKTRPWRSEETSRQSSPHSQGRQAKARNEYTGTGSDDPVMDTRRRVRPERRHFSRPGGRRGHGAEPKARPGNPAPDRMPSRNPALVAHAVRSGGFRLSSPFSIARKRPRPDERTDRARLSALESKRRRT